MSERPVQTESELTALVRAIDVSAPAALHARIEAMAAESARRGRRVRLPAIELRGRPALVAALALVAVVVALVAVMGSAGTTTAPLATVRAASVLTLRPATSAAPAESVHRRGQLAAAVEGVAFPYWQEAFGWRSVGARSDRLGGRAVTTVFYANGGGQRIGYAILAGTPPSLGGGAVTWRANTAYRLLHADGMEVIAWLRGGHLCVISGRGVDVPTLLRLASWGNAA